MIGECSQRYARDRRIVKTDEFSSVFRLRPTQRTAHFVIYTRANEHGRARLGMVVSKRFAPRAVTRNTIKRIAREIFRLSELAPLDYVVRLSAAINKKTEAARSVEKKEALRAELLRLFSERKK